MKFITSLPQSSLLQKLPCLLDYDPPPSLSLLKLSPKSTLLSASALQLAPVPLVLTLQTALALQPEALQVKFDHRIAVGPGEPQQPALTLQSTPTLQPQELAPLEPTLQLEVLQARFKTPIEVGPGNTLQPVDSQP